MEITSYMRGDRRGLDPEIPDLKKRNPEVPNLNKANPDIPKSVKKDSQILKGSIPKSRA